MSTLVVRLSSVENQSFDLCHGTICYLINVYDPHISTRFLPNLTFHLAILKSFFATQFPFLLFNLLYVTQRKTQGRKTTRKQPLGFLSTQSLLLHGCLAFMFLLPCRMLAWNELATLPRNVFQGLTNLQEL